jgi:hypothetical protein
MSPYKYELPNHEVEYGVQVKVDDLKIDPQAQRTLNERRAQGIADNLVPNAVGSIVVSERPNGDRFIVDGQHRKRAVELNGINEMVAEVHRGLDRKEEATLFLIKNRESTKPNPLDTYQVGLTAGLPLYVDTEKVLKKHDLEMGSTSANSIGAVAGVLRITDKYGSDVLERALSVAESAWGRQGSTWDGMLLGGIGELLGRHEMVDDDDELAQKIAKRGNAGWWIGNVHAIASGGGLHNTGTGSRVTVCYQMLLREWNKGKRKNRIPIPA